MSWTVPPAIEDALYTAAAMRLTAATLRPSALHAAIVDRSKRYTSDRDALSAPSNRDADLAARAVFFSGADCLKVALPLHELGAMNIGPMARANTVGDESPLRVVDLGAGCGAMSLGFLACIDANSFTRPIRITLVDRDNDALAIAKAAIAIFSAHQRLSVDVAILADNVASVAVPSAHVVLMGTVLNELAAVDSRTLVQRALQAIAHGDGNSRGAVIIIEPALRETTRALHVLRDAIIDEELGHVLAPCTRRASPCPMLADERDWCHEDRAVLLPPRTRALAHATGLRDSGLKFSYLALATSEAAPAAGASAVRVVSEAIVNKGKHELFVCGEDDGRVRLRLLHRHRRDGNRVFERAQRGDVLAIAPAMLPSSAGVSDLSDDSVVVRKHVRDPLTTRHRE